MATNNIQKIKMIYGDTIAVICGIFAAVIIGVISLCFTDVQLIRGNMGEIVALIHIGLGVVFVGLFSVFVTTSIYKIRFFQKTEKKSYVRGSLGGLLSVIATGCPSCSITLAIYIGLGSLLSLLPYQGLELKVVGILLLIYAISKSLKTLTTCTQKKKNL